jgi:hypothetical protein
VSQLAPFFAQVEIFVPSEEACCLCLLFRRCQFGRAGVPDGKLSPSSLWYFISGCQGELVWVLDARWWWFVEI